MHFFLGVILLMFAFGLMTFIKHKNTSNNLRMKRLGRNQERVLNEILDTKKELKDINDKLHQHESGRNQTHRKSDS